jgi:hypothetical protein
MNGRGGVSDIPIVLAELVDAIFKALPSEFAKEWSERFLKSIKPKANLELIWPEFAAWMLTDEKYGALQFAGNKRTESAIISVSDLYKSRLSGISVSLEDFDKAVPNDNYAKSAAGYARSAGPTDPYMSAMAAYAAAAAAASDHPASASDYATIAAYAIADNPASREARRNEWRIAQGDKLIQLLKDCPTL